MNTPRTDIRMAVGPPMDSISTSECWHCDSQGPVAFVDWAIVCFDCLDAFEREDAPWELAVTLGDIDLKERARACTNFARCPRYGTPTDFNFCQYCGEPTQ
jgi:hypothetical protein